MLIARLRAIWRKTSKPFLGYVVLVVAVTFAIGNTYGAQQATKKAQQATQKAAIALCVESHRRYDTLRAVLITSTEVSPVARARVTGNQLHVLERYYADQRIRLLATLGSPPTC